MDRKSQIILLVACVIGLVLVAWGTYTQAKAAKNLEKAIAAGNIKIQIAQPGMPSIMSSAN